MPRSAISHARTCCGSAPSVGRQRGDRGRLVERLDHPPALDVGQRGAGHPAELGQPGADLLGPGGQVLPQRHRIAHARSDIGLAQFQALHHRNAAGPIPAAAAAAAAAARARDGSPARRRRAGRPSICVTSCRSRRRRPRSRGAPAPARRRPPAAGRGRGTPRRARPAAGRRRGGWPAAVRCTSAGGSAARRRGGVVDGEAAVVVDGQRADLEAVGGHDSQVRAVLAGQAGDGAFARPAARAACRARCWTPVVKTTSEPLIPVSAPTAARPASSTGAAASAAT